MTQSFENELNYPFMGDDGAIDIDRLTDRMKELGGQVESYRSDLIRHIAARRDLLGIPEIRGIDRLPVDELLEIKNQLEREFRGRFHLNPEAAVENRVAAESLRDFHSGR